METCKDWYRGGDPSKPVPKLLVGTFGAVAGAASVFGNTPIDVVKTRMQVSTIATKHETIRRQPISIIILLFSGSRSIKVQKYNGLLPEDLEE